MFLRRPLSPGLLSVSRRVGPGQKLGPPETGVWANPSAFLPQETAVMKTLLLLAMIMAFGKSDF